MNLEDLLNSGAAIKIEISREDLATLAAQLIHYGEAKAKKPGIDPMLTAEEVAAIVRRDRTTLSRWHSNGTLKHNSLGLYSQKDVLTLINK